jgi:hypothetical protein
VIDRFLLYPMARVPEALGEIDVVSFLEYLALKRKLSGGADTQHSCASSLIGNRHNG